MESEGSKSAPCNPQGCGTQSLNPPATRQFRVGRLIRVYEQFNFIFEMTELYLLFICQLQGSNHYLSHVPVM